MRFSGVSFVVISIESFVVIFFEVLFTSCFVAIYIPSCVVHVVMCFVSSESILQAEQGYITCSCMKAHRQLRYFYIAQ